MVHPIQYQLRSRSFEMTKLPLIAYLRARHVAIDALALSPSLMGIPFFSWPRERRLVFLAIGGCFALSVYILLGHIEKCPPILCRHRAVTR